MPKTPDTATLMGILIAFLLWYLVFLTDLLSSFWFRVTTASMILGLYAYRFNGADVLKSISLKDIIYGVASGVSLYALFYLGFNVFKPLVSAGAENVYLIRTELPLIIPSALLLVTSLCEEYFWRGYIQSNLLENRTLRVIATSILYASIHLATLNLPLTFAALIAGLAWGATYEATDSIWIAVFSHIVWTELIFVYMPLI